MNNNLLNSQLEEKIRKIAQAIATGDQGAIAKIIQTVIRQACIVDQLYPPMTYPDINAPGILVSDTNPQKRYILLRYQINTGGPAYSIDINQGTLQEHNIPAYAPVYFNLLATNTVSFKEVELQLYGQDMVSEVIRVHVERFGDSVDIAFFNALRNIAFTRDVDTLGVDKIGQVQFLNAKYFDIVKFNNANPTIIRDWSYAEDEVTASANYVGAKWFLIEGLNKADLLRVAPVRVVLPVTAYRKITAWNFTTLGLWAGQFLFNGIERVVGGNIFQNLEFVPIAKVANVGAYANEVEGPININVVGHVREKDLDTSKTSDNEVPGKTIGYIVPTDSMFGANVIAGGIQTSIIKQNLDNNPEIRIQSFLWRGLTIGLSRAYIAFPAF